MNEIEEEADILGALLQQVVGGCHGMGRIDPCHIGVFQLRLREQHRRRPAGRAAARSSRNLQPSQQLEVDHSCLVCEHPDRLPADHGQGLHRPGAVRGQQAVREARLRRLVRVGQPSQRVCARRGRYDFRENAALGELIAVEQCHLHVAPVGLVRGDRHLRGRQGEQGARRDGHHQTRYGEHRKVEQTPSAAIEQQHPSGPAGGGGRRARSPRACAAGTSAASGKAASRPPSCAARCCPGAPRTSPGPAPSWFRG